MSSYSVMEGDTVRVCVSVICGHLQNETVMLSIINNTARGHCMKIIIILQAVDENFNCVSFSLYTAGIDFIAPEQMSITLTTSSESDCVMIRTAFDDQTSMDKQFQIMMQPSASTEPDSPIYMPSTTNITITNRSSTILSLKMDFYAGALTYFIIVPLPTIMPLEKKVSTGGRTGFQVNISFPVMKFQWLYNNMSIIDEEMRYSGIKTNNLIVMNIEKGDAGSYSCNVTTEFGLTVTSQQAQLQVCKYENCYHHLIVSMMRLSK